MQLPYNLGHDGLLGILNFVAMLLIRPVTQKSTAFIIADFIFTEIVKYYLIFHL